MWKLLIIVVMLSGCSTLPDNHSVKVVQQKVPIVFCPKPNWDGLQEPALAIHGITDETSAGEVAKRYKATIIQLQGYAGRLRKTLEQYNDTNEAYDKLREEMGL